MIKKLKYIYTKNLSKNVISVCSTYEFVKHHAKVFWFHVESLWTMGMLVFMNVYSYMVFLTDLTYSMSLFNQLYSFSTMSVLRYVYWILIAFQQRKACLKDMKFDDGKIFYIVFAFCSFVCSFVLCFWTDVMVWLSEAGHVFQYFL